MYQKFFIGFFIAAFVCDIMFCCGGVAEASMLGSFPNIQCATDCFTIGHSCFFQIVHYNSRSVECSYQFGNTGHLNSL